MGAHTSSRGDAARTASILDSLRRIVQLLREGSRASERHVGLSAAQLFVLSRLTRGSPLPMGALADQTFTHQSSVSTVVRRLAAKGLVAITPGERDRRQRCVSLTPAGRRALRRAPGLAQEALLGALHGMRPEARRRLATSLRQLAAGLPSGPPAMFFEDERTRAR